MEDGGLARRAYLHNSFKEKGGELGAPAWIAGNPGFPRRKAGVGASETQPRARTLPATRSALRRPAVGRSSEAGGPRPVPTPDVQSVRSGRHALRLVPQSRLGAATACGFEASGRLLPSRGL